MIRLKEVARALAKENGDDFDLIPRDKAHWVEMGSGRGVNELRQHDYLGMARAAIDAMREPTSEMERVGNRNCWNHDQDSDAAKAWRAMIDQALEESKI
jgi:hypothetical protein